MKIKNLNLESLIGVYAKIVKTDFEDYDLALNVAKNGFAVEDLMKAYQKIRESLIKKNSTEDGLKVKEESFEKFKVDFEKLNDVEQEIDLVKIPKSVIKTVKLNPLEAKLLDDLGIVGE